jgi:hypothetical protein
MTSSDEVTFGVMAAGGESFIFLPPHYASCHVSSRFADVSRDVCLLYTLRSDGELLLEHDQNRPVAFAVFSQVVTITKARKYRLFALR